MDDMGEHVVPEIFDLFDNITSDLTCFGVAEQFPGPGGQTRRFQCRWI
jgi:hypothetical protein